MALLELNDVSVSYGRVEALRGVSLRVEEGQIVALLGANGSGKSTTLRTISGLMRPQRGALSFAGQSIGAASPEKIVRLGIAHVPEGRRIFPGLTLRENILLGGCSGRVPRRELNADVERMFALFPEILPFADALGWTLSGGQQQMGAIARGLMSRPRLLLLDEPSLGLAPLVIEQLFKVIADIRRSGMTILLVEQNAHLALSIANRGFVLDTGKLAVEGNPAQLWDNDDVRAAYLGGAMKRPLWRDAGPRAGV